MRGQHQRERGYKEEAFSCLASIRYTAGKIVKTWFKTCSKNNLIKVVVIHVLALINFTCAHGRLFKWALIRIDFFVPEIGSQAPMGAYLGGR